MATASLQPLREAPSGQSASEFNIAQRASLMSTSPLFTGLTASECKTIAWSARPRTFMRDELLFMQGHPVRNLVLLQTGCVKLTQLSPNGCEVILWMNGTGQTVGVPAEAPACSHTCSARAMEQCQALTWEYKQLQSLLSDFPQIRKNIIQIQTARLQELEERFREVASERVAKRVALALIRLMKHIGKKARGGIEVSLSREELAQITGTTLFTVSRLLSKWAEEGLVLPLREAVVIRDAQRLELVGDLAE